MADPIYNLYETHTYPAMSHPVSDPAVSAVAARMAGLEVPHPSQAKILEIGCCSGLNLIPLAQRWPASECHGIDLSPRAIAEAVEISQAAGTSNVIFHTSDLRNFRPESLKFDYIIAHGFFSWVPDEVKLALMDFCHQHLTLNGIATMSFNVAAGWRARQRVIEKVQAIQLATETTVIESLQLMRSILEDQDPETLIVEDMLAKGAAILACDDFGPVNDPWSLDRVVQLAARSGLRWLGESDPGENLPSNLNAVQILELQTTNQSPLEFQMALDEASGRTFRSCIFGRQEAPIEEWVSSGVVRHFAVRVAKKPSDPATHQLYDAIESQAPACISISQIQALLPHFDPSELALLVFEGISHSWIRPRIEPRDFSTELPDFPRLNPLRLTCAQRSLPLVDIWHVPCTFDPAHYPLLCAMDGMRSLSELTIFAQGECPSLAFLPWMRHLAARGMFT